MVGNESYKERANKIFSAFSETLTNAPYALPQMCVALDFSLTKPKQIVIAGEPNAEPTKMLLKEIHQHYIPNKIVLYADGKEGQQFLSSRQEFLKVSGISF
jgi:uncharacterized protein YyaL (SSP411 family)